MTSRTKTALIILAATSLLAACGVRGALDKPSAAADGPAPSATADADSGQGKRLGDAPKPHKGFILDGLLQ